MSRDGWMKKRANAGDDNGWAARGGYMAAKVSKLDEQFRLDAPREKQKQGICSNIFSGVAIYINGYTDPNADELRRLMMLHGGQFHVYYSRSKTTHIIANNLPNCKIKELKGEKVIRPEWITDSVKAGHLLPYLQYQLYAKHKGPLFPGMTVRPTSEGAGPSHAQPVVRQKLPPNRQTNANHNDRPQSPLLINALPGHSASGGQEPKHRSPSHPHDGATKPPQSPLQTAHCNQRLGQQQQPQSNTCAGATKEVRVNGSLQSVLKTNDVAKDRPHHHTLKEAPLTNGHVQPVNGALKPQVPSLGSEEQDCRSARRPKPDPYEFPHSPLRQSEESLDFQGESGREVSNEQRRPSPPAHRETTEPKPVRTPVQADSLAEKSPLTSSSHSPLRLNGSHHKTVSSDPATLTTTIKTVEAEPPADKSSSSSSSSSKSSAQLQAKTGDLISEFYSHSRLHQISTWRTGFSEYVNELHNKRKAAGGATFAGKERLRKFAATRSSDGHGSSTATNVKSCIFHVDMDCFFVSVGIRHRPHLQGKPVAVTSNRGQGRVPLRPGANPQVEQQYYQGKHTHPAPERSNEDLHTTPSQESPDSHSNGVDQDVAVLSMAEIASCSYEARQAGVRNGMFFGKAKLLCPALQSVPYDFEAYKEVALTMYETLASYTHDIEALSCDEVLIDASALLAELGVGPEDVARAIRSDIKERTGCCASVGMGSNILLARLATRKAKPDGQYFLKSEQVDDFIRDLPVTSLPGVGPVMGRKLAAMTVRSCGDLQQVSLSRLQKKFGPRTGQTLFRFCRGLDDRPVRYEKERKSVSAEMNYNIRFTGMDEAESFLTNLSMEVQRRLQDAGLRGRRVTLKVMVRKVGAPLESAKYGGHGICDNLARTVMLAQSTDSGQLIAAAVIKLFHAMKLPPQDLRGLGIQVQLLEGTTQDSPGPKTRSIKDMFINKGAAETRSDTTASSHPPSTPEPIAGTSRDQQGEQTPRNPRARLNFSIEVPSPSQVDRSVLEALPPELREQVEQSWTLRDGRQKRRRSQSPHMSSPPPSPPPPCPVRTRPTSPHPPPPPPPALNPLAVGTLVLQFPNQPDSLGIVLELPNFSQVDPDVFAALPKELQEELKSAYNRLTAQPQAKPLEPKNPLLQLKQSGVGSGAGPGRVKRRYKRKNAVSPLKKPSPVKRRSAANSPAKALQPLMTSRETGNVVKTENNISSASSSKPELPEPLSKLLPRPGPALAGACELTDIKGLLREWVTTMTDPMEEDILQVVKYCTDLIEDKDLEKLDLVMKYMKRLMQRSVESVWSMAFDFILDNVQVVVQQTYGSTLKIS